jgi:hypothetical protein
VKPGPSFNSVTLILNLVSNAVHGYYTELTQDVSGNYNDGPHMLSIVQAPQMLHTSTMDMLTKSKLLRAPARNANVHDPAAIFISLLWLPRKH